MSSFPKTCGICQTSYTPESWALLPFVGFGDDGDGGHLSFRNCACGNTLVIPSNDDPNATEIAA